jgi:hypothetical protein
MLRIFIYYGGIFFIFVWLAKSVPKYIIGRRQAWKENALGRESMDLLRKKEEL